MTFNTRKAMLGCGAAIMALSLATQALAQQRTFDIPAQDAATAIGQFGLQAGVQITAPTDQLRGVRTPAVRGDLDTRQALARLLQDTGLEIASDNGSVIALRRVGAPQGQGAGAGPQATELEDIVVTGTTIRGTQPASPVQVITRKDIEASGYSDVGSLVRSLPSNFNGGQNPTVATNTGVVGTVNASNASTVNLRGLGPTATLTLLNGHRLPASTNIQAPDISVIPLSAVERVEAVTDGASALYGSDAVAGVVNFILRDDYEGAEIAATIGSATQGGGFNQTYAALAGVSWDAGHLLANLTYSEQEPIRAGQRGVTDTAAPEGTLLGNQDRISILVRAHQRISDHASVSFDSLYSESEGGTDFAFSPGSAVRNYLYESSTFLIAPSVEIDLRNDWRLSVRGSVSGADNRQYTRNPTSTTSYKNNTKSVDSLISGRLFTLPSGEVRVSVAAGYREEDFEAIGSSTAAGVPDVGRRIGYVSGEALIPISDDLEISISGRSESYSDYGSTFNPKVGVRYGPVSGLTLRGTWGTSFRAPTFYEMHHFRAVYYYPSFYFPGAPDGYLLMSWGGNPDLDAEKSDSYTIGFDWRPFNTSNLRVSATYYSVDYTDKIGTPVSIPTQTFTNDEYRSFITLFPTLAQQQAFLEGQVLTNLTPGSVPYDPSTTIALVHSQNDNISRQMVDGFDVSISDRFDLQVGSVDAFLDASYQRIDRRLNDNSPYERISGIILHPPKYRIRGGLTWDYEGISITGIANHISSETDVNVTPNERISSWTTLDMTAVYRFQMPSGALSGTEVSLAITNVFDEDPPFARGGAAQADGWFFDSANHSAMGRFVALTLRKRF